MVFIFLDGVGMGKGEPSNPFYLAGADYLPCYLPSHGLPDGTPVKAIDANLGVAGLPQSASGQTYLYSGVNVPQMIGAHRGSYPTRIMRKIIRERNILSTLLTHGHRAVFLNAYPHYHRFYASPHIHLGRDGRLTFSGEFPQAFRRHISVTTCMMIACRQIPFHEQDILDGNSIYQDYSNASLTERGLSMPEYSPETAADIIFQSSRKVDFLLYEYFQTDIYGHRRSLEEGVALIQKLNRLVKRLIERLDREQDTLLITSDHGNLEDATSRGHTRNPVPLILWGRQSEALRKEIEDITQVYPAIMKFFDIN